MNKIKTIRIQRPSLLAVAFLVLCAKIGAATAAQSIGWERPLQAVVASLTGPTAMLISIIAFVAGLLRFLFGGEMSDTMKWLVGICLIGGLIAGATGFVGNLMGITGAVV